MILSTGEVWLLIAACILTTVLIKAFGPVLVGGRELPERLLRVIALMAPALLAALVVTAALASGPRLEVGAHTAGVAAAGLLVWRGASILVAVMVAVLLTALLRALL